MIHLVEPRDGFRYQPGAEFRASITQVPPSPETMTQAHGSGCVSYL